MPRESGASSNHGSVLVTGSPAFAGDDDGEAPTEKASRASTSGNRERRPREGCAPRPDAEPSSDALLGGQYRRVELGEHEVALIKVAARGAVDEVKTELSFRSG